MSLTSPIGAHDHIRGNLLAPVTLTEYGDYECSFCGKAHPIVLDLLERLYDRVRVVFRHFPLSQAHPHALMAAQAAEAAGAQGKFWEMHDTLYENQDALAPGDLIDYAEALQLDSNRFIGELERGSHLDRVRGDLRSGVRSGVNGTPTFFVNDHRFDGSWSEGELIAAVLAAADETPRHVDR